MMTPDGYISDPEEQFQKTNISLKEDTGFPQQWIRNEDEVVHEDENKEVNLHMFVRLDGLFCEYTFVIGLFEADCK